MKNLYGLIGKNISYSFSRGYFTEKFKNLHLNGCTYENFDLDRIEEFKSLVVPKLAEIGGMNVTIPYKEAIMAYLDEIDPEAERIGAVNTIKILDNGRLKGFNTDVYGFETSLRPMLTGEGNAALILGTGGASKAVAYVLNKLGINYKFVSRNTDGTQLLSYSEIDEGIMNTHLIIINCTPLGTFPEIKEKPNLPYKFLTKEHLLFDLIYNPERTAFLSEGEKRGAKIVNGREMLEKQADRSWQIWNS